MCCSTLGRHTMSDLRKLNVSHSRSSSRGMNAFFCCLGVLLRCGIIYWVVSVACSREGCRHLERDAIAPSTPLGIFLQKAASRVLMSAYYNKWLSCHLRPFVSVAAFIYMSLHLLRCVLLYIPCCASVVVFLVLSYATIILRSAYYRCCVFI